MFEKKALLDSQQTKNMGLDVYTFFCVLKHQMSRKLVRIEKQATTPFNNMSIKDIS